MQLASSIHIETGIGKYILMFDFLSVMSQYIDMSLRMFLRTFLGSF